MRCTSPPTRRSRRSRSSLRLSRMKTRKTNTRPAVSSGASTGAKTSPRTCIGRTGGSSICTRSGPCASRGAVACAGARRPGALAAAAAAAAASAWRRVPLNSPSTMSINRAASSSTPRRDIDSLNSRSFNWMVDWYVGTSRPSATSCEPANSEVTPTTPTVIETTAATASQRGRRQRRSRPTSGSSRKPSSAASASGTKISRPKCKAAMTNAAASIAITTDT